MTLRLPLLVVDDSESERDLMVLTLAAAFPGAEIRSADHPYVAQQMCESQSFECVLTDYNMPDMDGVAMALQLRAIHPHMPIILMTSVGDEMLAVEAMRNGVSDYIPKSRVTIESIRRIVDRSIHACALTRVIEEQRGEIETFAYALAHDFKQPIRQIGTFSQLISETLSGHEIGDVKRHLTFLRSAAEKLGKLVDVMSQYTLANRPPELTDVDLARALGSVQASLAPFLEERGGSIVSTFDAPEVYGNETLMIQVLQNLVMNALQYNRSADARVEVTARAEADHIDIQVRDNGIGIEPEYLAEIFKPLVRLHNASDFPGSGLGLAIARRALISQKGEIWCESVLGQGSVFHLRLPAPRGARLADHQPPDVRARAGAA